MNHQLDKLLQANCREYSSDEASLNLSDVESMRSLTPHWQYCATENELSLTRHFDHYSEAVSFVNDVATIAEQENHHPEIHLSYKRCKINYSTHSVHGVTENDFICAAKIDQLIA